MDLHANKMTIPRSRKKERKTVGESFSTLNLLGTYGPEKWVADMLGPSENRFDSLTTRPGYLFGPARKF